jgi:hypothetical protein
LRGCGGGGGHQYSNLEDPRKAAVDAGLGCPSRSRQPSWHPQVPHSGVETGICSENSVLVLYTDGQDPEKEIERTITSLNDLDVGHPFVAGTNWTVNAPDAGDLQDAMGGKLVNMY